MGFAPVAAVLILTIASLSAFSDYNRQTEVVADELRAAHEASDERRLNRMETAMTIDGTSYNPGQQRIIITATNDGNAVVDMDGVDVMLDGEYHSDDITTIRIDNSADRYWAPNEELEITLEGITPSPARVTLIAHNGAAAYYEV